VPQQAAPPARPGTVRQEVAMLAVKGANTHSSNQLSLNASVHAAALEQAVKTKKPLAPPAPTK
jgi:hypothetical protein